MPSYKIKPTRPGETTRKCAKCGREYVPTARNQKYCEEHKTRNSYEHR